MSTTRRKSAPKAAPAEATAPKPKRDRSKPTTAPQAGASAAVSVAKATQPATTQENLASTTRANDPARESTVPANTTAEDSVGIKRGETEDGTGFEPSTEQAAGNRHSHPAETEAERSTRLASGQSGIVEANASGALPAGESADPAAQPQTTGTVQQASSQDESGAIQDATRDAIGAGKGAPDGVGDVGADPAEAEVNEAADLANGTMGDSAEVSPGMVIGGGKLKLWRALERGATREELMKASGYRSIEGTVGVLSRFSGREVNRTKNDDGVYVYKLGPLPEAQPTV